MKTPDALEYYTGSITPGKLLNCLFSVVLLLGCLSFQAASQTPNPAVTPTPAQTPEPSLTPLPIDTSTPKPETTPVATPTPPLIVLSPKDEPNTGANPPSNPADTDKTVNWTLRDAITMALENNVDISIERKNVRIAELNILSAEGVYDTIFTASPNFNSTTQPNIGRFSGLTADENSSTSRSLDLNAGLQKQIRYGGGFFQASFDSSRTTSNSAIVSPLYSPQLSFSFTQPLWRNRSIDNNRLQIAVAKKTLTLTDAQFRQQVITIITEVQQAYWNLAFAVRNVSVQSDGVDLAQKQVDENQKQAEVGTLAPLEVVTAKTTLETRRQALIQAQNAAIEAQNALKTLVVEGTQATVWDKDIFPTDFYEEQPLKLSMNDALVDAYANRPEVAQLNTQKEINKLNVDYFRNQTKPQIDLVSSYSITGAGGTPLSTLSCPTGTTLGSASLCVPGNTEPILTAESVNNKFIGGLGTSLGNLLTNQFNTVTVGVNISVPFHNKTAKANLGRALETSSQTELQERKQLQTIEVDVRNAYQSVQLAQKNLDAAHLARQYAETQLDGEQKKFAAGLSTTFLVLTRQNDLIQARGAEVNGLAAYNNAVSALQQATGSTLVSNNVEIK